MRETGGASGRKEGELVGIGENPGVVGVRLGAMVMFWGSGGAGRLEVGVVAGLSRRVQELKASTGG
jgi:hypothetical protein